MGFPSKEIVECVKKRFPVGTRVELVRMDDPQAPPIGTKGTVQGVDDIASIMVHWDNGSHLNVAYGEDMCRIGLNHIISTNQSLRRLCSLWLRIDLIICVFRANMYLPKRKTHLQEDDTMMNLQEILFFRAKAELDAYMDMKKAECYTEEEIERQRERFCSAYQIIEEAELESEYEDWKEKNA